MAWAVNAGPQVSPQRVNITRKPSRRRNWAFHADGSGVDAPPPPQPAEAPPRPSLADPAQTVVWGGTLPSRRRAVLGLGGALSIGEERRG